MSGQRVEQLIANHWAEAVAVDDKEVLGFWQRAIESFEDSTAPRVSRTGQFKHLYDAARQAVVAFNAAHGFRARGTSDHHQHTFSLGVALAPENLGGMIAEMQLQRGVRHNLEYRAHGWVTEEEVRELRDNVCKLLNGLANEIRRIRPAIKQAVKKLRCN
jgi:hypothetical protein